MTNNILSDEQQKNLNSIIEQNNVDDNTDNIRIQKHSDLIRNDIKEYMQLKKKYEKLHLSYRKLILRHENISFTFSKKDLSDCSGLGTKCSFSRIFSKNDFCSLFSVFGVQTLMWTNKSPLL